MFFMLIFDADGNLGPECSVWSLSAQPLYVRWPCVLLWQSLRTRSVRNFSVFHLHSAVSAPLSVSPIWSFLQLCFPIFSTSHPYKSFNPGLSLKISRFFFPILPTDVCWILSQAEDNPACFPMLINFCSSVIQKEQDLIGFDFRDVSELGNNLRHYSVSSGSPISQNTNLHCHFFFLRR